MTHAEKQIYRIISRDPMISQDDLAERLGISRSSVSVHISNLTKKGFIAGRGYFVGDFEKIVVIGASMMDIYGKTENPLLAHESNPGGVELHPGGVSRNISENLSRLGVNVSLISALCDDPFGQMIKDNCRELGIDVSNSFMSSQHMTTIYMAILDEMGDMALAISDTSALDAMDLQHIAAKESVINQGELIVIDASLPKDIMQYIVRRHSGVPIVIDPVSIGKAHKIKPFIGEFHTLKCNINEAEFLSDITMNTAEDIYRIGDYFIEKGLKQVFITLGQQGVFYQNEETKGRIPTYSDTIVNVTGAGDAFTAGVAYCMLSNQTIEYTAQFASMMSKMSLENMKTVNPLLSLSAIERLLQEDIK